MLERRYGGAVILLQLLVFRVFRKIIKSLTILTRSKLRTCTLNSGSKIKVCARILSQNFDYNTVHRHAAPNVYMFRHKGWADG